MRRATLKGNRADIKVSHSWAAGMHTSEVSRKRVTGSKFDVQFSDLGARHGFGFAAFDNAQARRALAIDPSRPRRADARPELASRLGRWIAAAAS